MDNIKEEEPVEPFLKIGPSRTRQERFSQEEMDVLFREVQARYAMIYGTSDRAPRVSEVRTAWEQVAAAVNASSSGPKRTSVQCRKRINDLRRRGKQKFAEIQEEPGGTGGSPPTDWSLTAAEVSAASTLATESVEQRGEIDGDCPAPRTQVPTSPRGQETGSPTEQLESGSESSQGTPRDRPRRIARHVWLRARPWRRRRRRKQFLELLAEGFGTLRRELAAIRRSINGLDSRLRRMDERAHPLRRTLSSSLTRIADAVDRQYGPAPPRPSPAQPRSPEESSSEDRGAQQATANPRRTPRQAATISSRLKSRRGRRRH
ncbi:hypothetical protein SKAU_G00282150 [Synaphobranchus kaupii]|uniref:Myb/SANT-like DNA-binding domain-containing protein n=1 Tax=Synaphobranchus kaupii TaxID=118154 RepID=A0A9Q1EXH9_SYNKA|nr:hypothetical protein SKAU_G00282150 [Synaphobranchus kaupii]